ncbi:MAG: NAD(P)H-hydrate epimerase [Asgard group archaeon]|nr:NAD(P)H-hydrate epimerase [Asgard group archaeon]
MKTDFPIISSEDIPFITVEQMKKVDELMMGKYQISLEKMMENAGLNLALLCRKLYPNHKSFHVLVGKGNNGGGGLVAARRLHNWGFNVKIILASEEDKLKKIPIVQLSALKELEVQILPFFEYSIGEEAIVLDTLLGYSLKGNPRENYAKIINHVNNSNLAIISLDIPSGIEGTSGIIYEPAIKADITMTLGLPKTAFRKNHVKYYLGRLFVADISVPIELFNEIDIEVSSTLFQKSTIVEIK